eukprot:CAMPEP_0197827148 /NCGR_PEP_ID=MMETSP1437-20131217/3994_1 /TAXON_ID=49252 ORGANISM="Eucampia antarctica, Strain CCMP1452" /NCGR_SAMPLE_ID=MMETSP1437 /ASSEMBLY_ACC=CAM_ASM_001096 /LENGTH=410 /DNA_ID=CAMNT_0043427889 /DNA_START=569 /DNA_END=1801 /DNA_ORIENTATION=+
MTLTAVHHGAQELYEKTALSSVVDVRIMMNHADDLVMYHAESATPEFLFQRKLNDARLWTKCVNPAIAFICLAAYAVLCVCSFYVFVVNQPPLPVKVFIHIAGPLLSILCFLLFFHWTQESAFSTSRLENFQKNPKDLVTGFDRFRQIYNWLGPTPTRKVQFIGAVIGAAIGIFQTIFVGFLLLVIGMASLLSFPHAVRWFQFIASFDIIGVGIVSSRRLHRPVLSDTNYYITIQYGIRYKEVNCYLQGEFSVPHTVYKITLVNETVDIAVLPHYPRSCILIDKSGGVLWRYYYDRLVCYFWLVCGTIAGFVLYWVLVRVFDVWEMQGSTMYMFAVLPILLCITETKHCLHRVYHNKVRAILTSSIVIEGSKSMDEIGLLNIDEGEPQKFKGVLFPGTALTVSHRRATLC